MERILVLLITFAVLSLAFGALQGPRPEIPVAE